MGLVKTMYVIKNMAMNRSNPEDSIDMIGPIAYDSYENAVKAIKKKHDENSEAGKIKVFHNENHLLSAPSCVMRWKEGNYDIIYCIHEVKILKIEETE